MPKSAMLRVSDVCAAYRIIGDCRDVGGDPTQWEHLALKGMSQLAGGVAATGGEGVWLRPSEPLRPMTAYAVGLDEVAHELYCAYMREQGVLADPVFHRLQHVSDQLVTRTRRQLVTDREWYHSTSFNEYRKRAGLDHQLVSVHQRSSQGAMSSLFVLRPIGDRDFSERERCLASFFHGELGRLIGGALVSAIERSLDALSPRLRQTLACLVEGDSEKQVAAHLGLSHSTVHQYITMLYRRFNVKSRAELMSHLMKRRDRSPVSPQPSEA